MANEQGVIPSQDAWNRVSSAVRKVEGGQTYYTSITDPPVTFPAVVVRVTGPKSGDYYPGMILTWDSDTEAWVDVENCYIRA